DILADLLLDRAGKLGIAGSVRKLARVTDALLELIVADRIRSFLEAPRCITLIVARGTGEAVDLLLELGDLLDLLFLLLDQPARLFGGLCARHSLETVHTLGDRALLACELLRAVECLLCLLLQCFTLAPLQPPARLFQLVQCGICARRVAAARI